MVGNNIDDEAEEGDGLLEDSDWLFETNNNNDNSSIKRESKVAEDGRPKLTDPEIVRRVYLLGRTISRAFDELGLFYWTSGNSEEILLLQLTH